MGMYDTVICNYPLPDDYRHTQFQTEDLECAMYTYRITPEGRLMFRDFKFEEDITMRFGFRRIELDEIDTDFHGDLNFYDWDEKTLKEYSYVARFTDGQLQWIRLRSDIRNYMERNGEGR